MERRDAEDDARLRSAARGALALLESEVDTRSALLEFHRQLDADASIVEPADGSRRRSRLLVAATVVLLIGGATALLVVRRGQPPAAAPVSTDTRPSPS